MKYILFPTEGIYMYIFLVFRQMGCIENREWMSEEMLDLIPHTLTLLSYTGWQVFSLAR